MERVEIRIEAERKARWQAMAESSGMSLTAFLVESVEVQPWQPMSASPTWRRSFARSFVTSTAVWHGSSRWPKGRASDGPPGGRHLSDTSRRNRAALDSRA